MSEARIPLSELARLLKVEEAHNRLGQELVRVRAELRMAALSDNLEDAKWRVEVACEQLRKLAP